MAGGPLVLQQVQADAAIAAHHGLCEPRCTAAVAEVPHIEQDAQAMTRPALLPQAAHLYTLGCHSSETKRTLGAEAGYSAGKLMRRAKMPPSHGVSSGPNMVAFHMNRLSSKAGLALQPSGGAWLICFRSLASLSCAEPEEPSLPEPIVLYAASACRQAPGLRMPAISSFCGRGPAGVGTAGRLTVHARSWPGAGQAMGCIAQATAAYGSCAPA